MRYWFVLAFLLFLGDSTSPEGVTYSFFIEQERGEIEGREDFMGRNEYLQLLTSNPATGEIPSNVIQAELAFARNHEASMANYRTQDLQVASIGPDNVGGRTRAVAFDVRNSNVILAGGVSGAVWKSTDGGLNWRKTSHPENRNSVTCIVQDTRPGKEDVWYHGTGEIVGNSARGGGAPFRGDGIYKSTDNGESWFPLLSTQSNNPGTFNNQFQYVWRIETNPENEAQDEVLAAVFGAIVRSLDGGLTWNVVVGQELNELPESADLNESSASFYTDLHRSANNVFYASMSTVSASAERSPEAGFYVSPDGASWQDITPLTEESGFRRAVISSSPSNPDITYFLIDSSPILFLEHRFSRINATGFVRGFDPTPREVPAFEGESATFNTQNSYNLTLRVHPENPEIVFIGATNLYRSTDAFRTQENSSWIGGYHPDGTFSTYPNHHPDQHELIFLPEDSKVAYSACDGGLFRTENIEADSVSWSRRSNGYLTSQFFTVAQSPIIGDETVMGGMQDNGTDLSVLGNRSWTGLISGDGGFAATTRDNSFWLASFQRGQTLRLLLNENLDVTSFARVDPGSLVAEAQSGYLFINPFVVDPTNENRAFFAGGNHLYYHPNISQIPGGSQTPTPIGWSKVNQAPVEVGQISAIEIARDASTVYFGTSAGQVFRLKNANQASAFAVEAIDASVFPEGGYVSSIAVNPENQEHLLVIFSNYLIPSIFESRDGGETFTDVSGNLEQNLDGSGNGPSVRWGELIPTNSGVLAVVGTSTGLYSSTQLEGISTLWVRESSEVLGKAVITMMDYRPEDGRLVIATHGNGMFETFIPNYNALPSPDPPEVVFAELKAYPNPFAREVRIRYSLPESGEVRIDILTASGQLIKNLLWARQFSGENIVVWDGTNAAGTGVPNGVYFYRIQYKDASQSGRMVLRR